MKTPYSELKRDCQNLHNFTEKDIKKFIEISKIKEGDKVLDAMAGNGAIAKEISKINNIELHILDSSEFQISEAKKNITKAKFHTASALKMPFKNNFFDKIFIRNAIYEIPKNKQIKLYQEILRILKKEGIFINWTLDLDETNQKTFQKLVKEKDKIAGFDQLVTDRYFMTKNELEEDLKKVGFSQINFINLNINYLLSTKKWFEVDYKGDEKKTNKLNNYIRSLGKIPKIEISETSENNIEIKIPALISLATK